MKKKKIFSGKEDLQAARSQLYPMCITPDEISIETFKHGRGHLLNRLAQSRHYAGSS